MDASSRPVGARSATPGRAATPARPSVSLVLPAYNEEDAIVQAIAEADAALALVSSDYEIIVVDDGSSDDTVARARAASIQFPSVRVVSHDGNQGYGAALRTGFAAATKDLVGFTDADCQFDLTELDRLVLLARSYDFVCGYRIDRKDHWHRLFFSKGYSTLVGALLGTRVRDCDCALKLMRREAIVRLPLESKGFFINAELLTQARLHGLSLVEVGVSHRPRDLGASKVSLRHIVPVLRALLPYWWTRVMFPRKSAPHGADDGAPTGIKTWHVVALFLTASVLLLSNLSYPLIEPDEGRYALIAASMVESGNYLVPMRQGEPYLDKPPLLYWLTALSYQLFGVHDYTARYVTAAAALGTMLAVYSLGRRLVGQRAALCGTTLLLLCIGFVFAGRFLIMDGLLTLFTTTAILSLMLAARGPRLHAGWWMIGGLACGLGVMTKGPVALVISLPALIASRWLTKGGAPIRVRDWAMLAGCVIGVAGPWFAAICLRETEFIAYFFWRHNVIRFVNTFHHAEPWWYYLPVLVVGMFPSSLLAPFVGVYLFSRSRAVAATRSWEMGYFLLAGVWVTAFFSCASGKLLPYILPALPLFCLLAGCMLDATLLAQSTTAFFAAVGRSLPIHGARVGLLASIVVAVAGVVLGGLTAGSVVLCGGIVLVSAIGIAFVSRATFRDHAWRFGAAPAALAAAIGLATIGVYPLAADKRSAAVDVARLRSMGADVSTPLVSFPRYEDSLLFYNPGQEIIQFPEDEVDALVSYLARHDRVLFVSTRSSVDTVRRRLPESVSLDELPGSRGRVYVCESHRQGESRSATRAVGTSTLK